MKRSAKVWGLLGLVAVGVFVTFTLVVAWVDVADVGLAHLNHAVLDWCGHSAGWRHFTDVLGYLLIVSVFGLACLQVWQWVRRKSLRAVDRNLWAMDAVLVALALVYIFFEIVVVNYRPELGDAVAKASYPSSHAMLFATLLPVLMWQVWRYVPGRAWRVVLTVVLSGLLAVGVVGRLLSGVHWFTDIVAGVLVGVALNCGYAMLVNGK